MRDYEGLPTTPGPSILAYLNIFHRFPRKRNNSLLVPLPSNLCQGLLYLTLHPIAHVACIINCTDLADRSVIKCYEGIGIYFNQSLASACIHGA